ncbi:SusD/RagB family nutrient-binding outer membrane lipoprotein [Flavitalea flava]
MKSTIKILRSGALAFALFAGGACTKNFQEINTDPTLVTSDIIKPSMLFTAVLKNSIFSTYNTGIITEYSGYYSNQGSGVIFQNSNWSEPFNSIYKDYLINTAEVIRLTADDPKLVNEHASARIWKVWLFQQLTDTYGDVPYFEATQNVKNVINQPKYDSQKDIYTDMFKELKEAVAQLDADPTLPSFGNADLLFTGKTDQWKRFGNSLRLRLALRVSNVDAAMAKQNILDVISQPLLDDNSLNALLTTIDGSNTNNRNPLFDDPNNPYPLWASFTTTDNLQNLNDPRLTIFSSPAADGVSGYRGRPIAMGSTQGGYTETTTAILPYFFRAAVHDIIVMNAAEVSFLRAEAALNNLSSEDANQLYRQGITQSLAQYNADPGASAAYLASPAATLSGTQEEQLEQIIVQKWLGNYYESTEAWAEFRRTGYPRIWTGNDLGSTNGQIPRRLTYPLDEQTKNETNVKAASALLSKGDSYMSRIWWDVKPGLPFLHPLQGTFPIN